MRARKKQVEIEYFIYDGDFKNNKGEWYVPNWAVEALENGVFCYGYRDNEPWELSIVTISGYIDVEIGDYIIRGVEGEIYPCSPSVFETTYDVLDQQENNTIMKKYLVIAQVDVADEGDVGLIKVVNESQLESYNSVYTGFGNIEGECLPFYDAVVGVHEISEDEFRVLNKFGLCNLHFGYCRLSKDEPDNDQEDGWDW